MVGPEDSIPDSVWVRGVLACLAPRERDVVACVDVVGMTVSDAARALGMTPVAVRVARHRALRRLRRENGLGLLTATLS